jgi:D-serine dehydratase
LLMEIKDYTKALAEEAPAIQEVIDQKETLWVNPRRLPFDVVDGLTQLVVSDDDICDAEARLARFAPYIRQCFPETEETGGLIESPLAEIPAMQKALSGQGECQIPGRLLLKMDSHLAIAGSVKARGGIYEVLKHAEELAIAAGRLREEDDYRKLAEPEMKEFFGQYTVQVGSTGNLGLSIGIMSAFLGFNVKVHMSADAKQWKKDMLRSKGVNVIEYEDDYSRAVAEGRKQSDADPMSYFVDDEYSVDLFLGYAVAAGRLREQFQQRGIRVDADHPLIVYVPAGVGGAPGGVCYGLKRLFGDDVYVFFTEPVLCPSLLVGFASQRYETANVHDFGLSGETHADGLACASPSGFVTRICNNLVEGDFTIDDYRLYDYMRMLMETEDIRIEPSSCASFIGPVNLLAKGGDWLQKAGLTPEKLENTTQICWATGGRLVPEEVWEQYLNTHLRGDTE